jgi:hypothetical protein
LLRIRITSGIDGDYGGNWYSPDRAGEGFTLEVTRLAQPIVVAEWYTYAPDGSGTPIWLFGSAAVNPDLLSATIDMYQTHGGAFASTQNPATVVPEKWGTLDVGFFNCGAGHVYYTPLDSRFPAGDYQIQRVAPQWHPPEYNCGTFSLGAPNPSPVP